MTTYLIKDINEKGKEILRIATKYECIQIMNNNKSLPLEKRRLFIKDIIVESDHYDAILIEVTLQEYRKWNSQNTMKQRNEKASKEFEFTSLDDNNNFEKELILSKILNSSFNIEDKIIDRCLIQDLKNALHTWNNWGEEMLDLYLQGNHRKMTNYLAEKYNVSEVTIRKRKKQFEDFLKNFLF